MNSPICDFVEKYQKSNACRFHMPGHKGVSDIGIEPLDITEIDGADCLSHASGIIEESRKNACELFGSHTFYSTEGCSHAIRAMIFLALKYAKEKGYSSKIVSGRNAHKSFLSACAVMDVSVDWLYPQNEDSYLSCTITAERFNEYLSSTNEKPCALYITSPDYIGNVTALDEISKVCKKHDVLLLLDNAHGAYLKFLSPSMHPIDHGADMCCDSAHKTLPCLTGGAYLHVADSENLSPLVNEAKNALAILGSTSPSYIILQSLDRLNKKLYEGGKLEIQRVASRTNLVKNLLVKSGYTLLGNEPLKITIKTKPYGYTGIELHEYLSKNNIVCEFYDQDYLVLMTSSQTSEDDFSALEKALTSLSKKEEILTAPPTLTPKKKALSFKESVYSLGETVCVKDAVGRILATVSVSCPPAVPIVVCGEIIDQNAVENFTYYGIESCNVIK